MIALNIINGNKKADEDSPALVTLYKIFIL